MKICDNGHPEVVYEDWDPRQPNKRFPCPACHALDVGAVLRDDLKDMTAERDELEKERDRLQSLHCTDYRAHCIKIDNVIQDRAFQDPCKWVNSLFLAGNHHPSSLVDRLQAMAVEKNVDWCPNFKAENLSIPR